MRLFRKKVHTEVSKTVAIKKELYHRIFTLCLVTTIAAVAGFAYMSTAWFVNNNNVAAQHASISSETATTSLFINAGTTPDHAYEMAATVTQDIKLFPISTTDCLEWYYVSGWDNTNGVAKTTSYTQASFSPLEQAGLYYNTYEERTLNAFSLVQFNVYTNTGVMDVYLNPENPITVTYPNDSLKQLDNAVRIGLVADTDGDATKELVMVYAPDETEVGNSDGQTTAGFYAVGGAGLVTAPYLINSDWTTYAAKASETVADKYEVDTNSVQICSTDINGEGIDLYIWLEGTDAETEIGVTDNGTFEADGLSVELNLVGVIDET